MQKSKINWTDFTWNPWWGCSKVSAECRYCYIDEIMKKLGYDPKKVYKTSPTTWNKPLKLNEPSIIFTCSLSDFFHPDADKWREEAWEVIKKTPQHTYLILTKRPERIKDCLPKDWKDGYPNVWLGVSVGNNEAISRIGTLQEIPAVTRFISFEPLIEGLDLKPEQLDGIHWGIIGGESGVFKNGKPQFREAKPEWFRSLRDVLKEANVLVWFKQAGTFLARKHRMSGNKGDEWNQLPIDLRIRERPDLVKKAA